MASNEGALTGYGELGVEKAEFYAAIDERACDDCLALHQDVFTLEDSHGMIPIHPNCRCIWLPVVE
jgi:SPP1 gp7 family putative phage head morphogenesis protein